MAASSFLAALRVHVLKVKFTSDELLSLDGTIIVHGGQIEPSPAKADVILTRLLSRRRLEMSLADGLVDNKVIVSDRWLHDCISLSRLLDYKLYLLPPDHADDFDVPAALASSASSASHSPMSSPEPQPIRKRNRTTTPAAYGGGAHGGPGAPPHDGFVWAVDAPASPPSSPAPPGVERLRLSSASPSLAPLPPLPSPDDYSPFPHVPDHLIPRSGTLIDPASLPTLACKRPSPLVCVNQRMCEELFVILLWKEVGEDDVGGGAALTDKHALSYKRAISAVKAYPTLIKTVAEARKLPQVGAKISQQIGEYLQTGHIALASRLRRDGRLHCLLLFQTLHTVGPHAARDLYDVHGCRDLADVRAARPALALEVDYWGELHTKIPRDEVEEIAAAVHAEMERIRPGSLYTICGGYRRGKTQSGDVDMVVTHPKNPAFVNRDVLDTLIQRLTDAGLVLNTVAGNQIGAGKDVALEQSFVVLRLPDDGARPVRRLRRRVDIIFAPFEVYWTAVLGWSGSQQFERDIRTHANQLEAPLRFNSSGITRLLADGPRRGAHNRPLAIDPAKEEAGVFEALGLVPLRPEERNADC